MKTQNTRVMMSPLHRMGKLRLCGKCNRWHLIFAFSSKGECRWPTPGPRPKDPPEPAGYTWPTDEDFDRPYLD